MSACSAPPGLPQPRTHRLRIHRPSMSNRPSLPGLDRTEPPMETDDSRLVAAAEATMRAALAPSIFNHTMRVAHLAAHLARGERVDGDTLAVTALFHDAGTAAENDGD